MSATTAASVALRNNNKFPFTTTQWQELEHQALIYKYMAAGIPIPPDLLFNIKRSLDSSISSKLFPYQTSPLGWNPYQMGYGKKIDPEPGRCRRTDGKKWRCSKEAYPDSKYCERHMHRGKNRSRKPVESSPLTNNTNANNVTVANNSNSPLSTATNPLNVAAAAVSATNLTNQSLFNKTPSSNSLYSSFPSSDSSYNSTNNHLLYPHTTSPYGQKDYRDRYYHGLKEEVGEHAFFTESSGSSSMRGFSMDQSWQQQQQHPTNNSNYITSNQQHQEQGKQSYIWGRDFNCELSMKVIAEEEERCRNKTTHHFFDEWPIKTGGATAGLGDDSSSTTQLSISIPTSASNHHDFFLSNSRNP
ncbi:hypothetical protein vseg_000281 [Gypsophila vaccaria]